MEVAEPSKPEARCSTAKSILLRKRKTPGSESHCNLFCTTAPYLTVAGIADDAESPLFRSVSRERTLTPRRMYRVDVLRMIKRRARQAGLATHVCCHTFRATGITAYLQNGGSLEHAQRIAAHESVRTTSIQQPHREAV